MMPVLIPPVTLSIIGQPVDKLEVEGSSEQDLKFIF